MVKKKAEQHINEDNLIPGAVLVPTSDLPDASQLSEPDPNVVVRPLMSSPAWSDYVLTHFEDTELFEGYPKVEGLRRVTELLLGPIIQSCANEPSLQSCSTRDGVETLNFWVVSHTVEVDVVYEDHRGRRLFTEVGNVNAHNTKNEMLRWGPEFASTRAESRALRKALKLKTMSYEEATAPPLEELEITPDTPCSSSQKNFLLNIAERNNIDIYKYISVGKNKYNKLDEVPFKVAVKMIEFLSECQRDPSKIPEGAKK